MDSTVKLTQIIGTLADQKADIPQYNQEDVNQAVSELLKRDLTDSDGSQARVLDVIGCALQNIHLSESLVAEVIYKLIKGPIPGPLRNKRLREYFPLALNHPNISQMHYVHLLSGYLMSGYWLSSDYSHHLVRHENSDWHSDNVLTAISLNIPSLRECFNEDPVRNEGLDYFLVQFFTVYQQIIDVNDPRVIESFQQLFSKMSPMRVKKLNFPRTERMSILPLDPAWGESYLKVKQIFLERFNQLPYDPNPYGIGSR